MYICCPGGRIIRVLMENGIARENVEGVLGVLRYIAGEIGREGDAFELDPEVRAQLEDMGLTDEQIDFVVGLAHRLASRPTDDYSERENGIRQRTKGRG